MNESITLALLDNEKLSSTSLAMHKDIFDSRLSMIDRKKYLGNEYLKKIIPPAFRHNVVSWNLSNIPQFYFDINDKETGSLSSQLNKIFDDNNMFIYKLSEKKHILKSGYNIFDNTPRELVNVFYYTNISNEYA